MTLLSSDGQPVKLLSPLTFSDGAATATVELQTADTLALSATSGSMTGTSAMITTSPGPAANFLVSAPIMAEAGIGFSVTISAEDAFGNSVASFNSAVTLTSGDGQTVVLLSSPVFYSGTATVTAALNRTDAVTISAASGAIAGTSGRIDVTSRPVTNDWFSQNMTDLMLQDLARTDDARDGSLTYGDMLGLFAAAESEGGALTAAALQSLQALVTTSGSAAVNLSISVQSLASKVVDGDPANATYLGTPLGNLVPGSPPSQLEDLVDKWFLGEDLPVIDPAADSSGSTSYELAAGTLFGTGGPSYKDVCARDGRGLLAAGRFRRNGGL